MCIKGNGLVEIRKPAFESFVVNTNMLLKEMYVFIYLIALGLCCGMWESLVRK